jgi:hypothetical protein
MSKKKKDELVMPKMEPTHVTTKTPTGEEAFALTHQEVNFGNVERTKLLVLSNINTTLLDILRELKKANAKST